MSIFFGLINDLLDKTGARSWARVATIGKEVDISVGHSIDFSAFQESKKMVNVCVNSAIADESKQMKTASRRLFGAIASVLECFVGMDCLQIFGR